jgi:hypothetical protein
VKTLNLKNAASTTISVISGKGGKKMYRVTDGIAEVM